MKKNLKRIRRGFTLIELSIAIMLGMATSGMVLALFNQQLAFLNLFKNQNFLTEEAPIINNYVSRLIGKADRFRLHANLADALRGDNPALVASPVLVLSFLQPDGSIRSSILEFVVANGISGLNYYLVDVDGTVRAPQWVVTRAARNVSFSVDVNVGVLRMTIIGPNSEQVIYSGTM